MVINNPCILDNHLPTFTLTLSVKCRLSQFFKEYFCLVLSV